MPKKRSKIDKEKPLLSVQGVLRLEKSFIPPRHEDAEYLEVPGSSSLECSSSKKVLLIPGVSEHELVDYKSGYEIGPPNPFPTNEPEEILFKERLAVQESQEAFQRLKETSEAERKAREAVFSSTGQAKPNSPLVPPGEEDNNETQVPLETFPKYTEEAVLQSKSCVEDNHNINDNSQEVEPARPTNAIEDAKNDDVLESVVAAKSFEGDTLVEPSTEVKPFEDKSIRNMALSVALEMEEKRKKDLPKATTSLDPPSSSSSHSLHELHSLQSSQETELSLQIGPQITEDQMVSSAASSDPQHDGRALLASYWTFVNENPRDFNGWTYLIQQAEHLDILEEVRGVYNAFLPLYPYCYAYWIRYSDIEKKKNYWERSLAILHRGLEAVPLSVDLWITYLEMYRRLYRHHERFNELFRDKCERAVLSAGLEYRSDGLWERYIEWESERKNLRHVTKIFRRLVAIPTKLYNQHWDNLIAHIRDHHPRDILDYDEYEELRRITCQELGLTYRPDPVIEPSIVRRVVQPEDKLKVGMKERIVAGAIGDHEATEATVDEISAFEDKIKRPYFHVKGLDSKQLKNWDSYLELEISKGNHERIIVLFERCLIPCANYEAFWIKYARYLESFLKSSSKDSSKMNNSFAHSSILNLEKARWSFGSGLKKVEDLKEKRCAWTLRGWKEEAEGQSKSTEEPPKSEESSSLPLESTEKSLIDEEQTSKSASNVSELSGEASQKEIETEMSSVLKTSWSNVIDHEAVRSVYKRACCIHCTSKALVQLKWAAFEEECGHLEEARDILNNLSKRYPLLLECCMQLIDIQRRLGAYDKVDEMYKRLIKKIPQNRRSIKTWASMKYARFLFKVVGSPDKALGVLRAALKRERGEPRLYSQIIDICYQRSPIDVAGFSAAIELALNSAELSSRQKFEFAKRKTEFLQEFGDVKRLRDALDQLKIYRTSCAQELRLESKKKKELQIEEQKLKELEEIKAKTRAMANIKAKIAETEGKLMCTSCRKSMFPNAQGLYEFEHFRSLPDEASSSLKAPAVNSPEDEEGVLDLLDLQIPEEQALEIQNSLKESTKYKEVAPTWELNIETYGYGKRRKIYDPDYEHIENAKFREYERLEIEGYDESLKDPDHKNKSRSFEAPGLGSSKEGGEEKGPAYTTSDYIVPPKVPQLAMGSGIGPARPEEVEAEEEISQPDALELPPEIANPQKSPCVNVPDWFVKDGGELCLSDTPNGISIIRYWPKFLSDKGNSLMFNRLRKYCKWHQKQVKIGGEWKYETRLVAWYGPCDYINSGLNLEKNLNWAPELLDLLHRLMSMTNTEYNSCFANLYRHGHDMCGWHADGHPQLGVNPTIASVSLGVVRVFEFRKKSGPPNFIRFPLNPGSLLVMEGATQQDWLHCLPRDTHCKEERINLTFRNMYSIDKRMTS